MPGITPSQGEIVELRTLCAMTTTQQIGLNVTHWKVVNVVALGTDLPTFAAFMDARFAPAYKSFMGVSALWRGVGATNISGVRSREYTSATLPGPGTGAPGTLPGQVTGIIRLRTSSAGRHYRGRIYPPFPAADNEDVNGEMNDTGLARLTAIKNALGISFVVNQGASNTTFQLVILHRPTPSRPIPPNDLTSSVTDTEAFGFWGTQRRRGDFGAANLAPF